MAKPLIFILEDHTDTAEMLQHLLNSRGYPVTVSHDPADALAKLHTMRQPCVFFLDHNLPGIHPAEFKARAQQINPPVHIVLITGLSAEEKARELGIQHYLQKPFDLEEAVELVTTLSQSCKAA